MEIQLDRSGQKPDEILSLTSVRGLASLWIVLFHLWGVLTKIIPEIGWASPLITKGYFSVPLFFVLSGYVLALNYGQTLRTLPRRHLFKFWLLRLGRIYPIHLITLLASLVLVARHGWPSAGGHSPNWFIANLLLIHAWSPVFSVSWNYPAWSVSSEWFAYLFCPWLFVFLRSLKEMAMGRLLWITILASILAHVTDDLYFHGVLVVIPTFSGGAILAALNGPSEKNAPPFYMGYLLFLLFLFIPFCFSSKVSIATSYILFSFLLVAQLGRNPKTFFRPMGSRVLVYLGEISYSLYLSHAITITVLTSLFAFERYEKASLPFRTLIAIGTLAVILVTASILFHAAEKPCRSLFRRLLKAEPVH